MERELPATHWRGYAQQQFPQSAWSVDGDVLRAIAAGPRVDLISRESFRDFVLCFDWRLARGGRSAVAYRRSEGSGAAAHTRAALPLLGGADPHGRAGALPSPRAVSRLVTEIRRQPALRFFRRQPFAARVVLERLAVDLAAREVARLRVGDVPAAHRRGRVHGVGLGEADAGAALDVEQAPELGLLGVIPARRVAGCRADALILLAHQLVVGERLRSGGAPQVP